VAGRRQGVARAGGAIAMRGGRRGDLHRTTESRGQGEEAAALAAGRRAGVHTRALRWRRGMKGRGGSR
jgi:hypothetical protein